jgi:hypothetical protein
MIHHKVAGQSEAWWKLRGGIPTASQFKRLITPTGKISAQADDYMHILLAEYVIGHAVENYKSEWMDRGTELEDKAVLAYEFQRDVETEPGGFFTDDLVLSGASPDRLVGTDGLLEIKCPLAHTHVRYLLTGKVEEEYKPQLQGQLLLSDRKWVDIVSYHPEMPAAIIRVERDDQYIKALGCVLSTFIQLMLRRRDELAQRYNLRPPAPAPEPTEDRHAVSMQDVEDILTAQREDRI